MSFENMKDRNDALLHERSCMMMYYFTPQEAKQIMNIARMVGIKDCVLLKPSHGSCVIRDILDQKLQETDGEAIKEKAIILNGIAPQRMSLLIDSLKKCRIKRPLIAVVTSQSIDWTLNDLIINLSNERVAVRNGEFSAHE